MLTRLPTFTPTRLPTLTPTANSIPATVAIATEAAGAAPALTPPPAPSVVAPAGSVANPTPLPTFTSIPAAASESSEVSDPTDTSAVSPPSPDADTTSAQPLGEIDTQTSTPTGAATKIPSQISTPTVIPTEIPPTSTPTPPEAPTPVSETSGWTFANVQIYPDQYEDGLLLYGEVINNTGTAQELDHISGTFYDAQGQIIADENSTGDFWPFKFIPPGERLPFGLFVDGIDSAANFGLRVQAEPGSETQRVDFQFLDLNQWVDEIGEYCVAGELRNPGGELQEYVLMMAILYDSQEKVVNFGDELEPFPGILGDDTLEFEICVQTLGQAVARYELRAWGK